MKRFKLVVLIIVLLSLAFFVGATDWSVVLASIQKVGYKFLILLFSTFVSAWLAVMAWRYCMPADGSALSVRKLFWIRLIGENIAILNPTSMIGGEAAKIYMLQDAGMPQRQALHSIILSRAMMIFSQIAMLLIAIVLFLTLTVHDFYWPVIPWWWLLMGIVTAIAVGIFLASRFFKLAIRILLHQLRLLNHFRKARLFIAELWSELLTFYRENKRGMLFSFLFCCFHWIVGSFEFYLILLFLGVKTTIFKALLVDMGVIVFKTAGAFVPGQIGVEEYGNKVMLAIIGIAGHTIWITASILRRARQLFWIGLGFVVYFISFHGRPSLSKP